MADMTLRDVRIARIRLVADGLRRRQEFESARYLDEYGDHLAGIGEPAQAKCPTCDGVGHYMNDSGETNRCWNCQKPTAPPASGDVASLQSRLAAADALLRKMRARFDQINRDEDGDVYMNVSCDAMDEIDAYLSENTRG